MTLVAASGAAEAALVRLVDSLAGTGPMFAQLAAFGLIAIALGAGARAATLWMEVHQAARAAARAADVGPRAMAAVATPAPRGAMPIPVPSVLPRVLPMGAPTVAPMATPAPSAAVRDAGVPPRVQHAAEPAGRPHRSTALLRAVAQRLRPAARGARAGRTRRHTPQSVRQLAESGAARPEIARRTGLSQDAVGLALHLSGRQL